MANVLLTVSGVVAADLAEQVARGARPRADYHELANAFDADVIDYAEHGRYWRDQIVQSTDEMFEGISNGDYTWLRA